MGNVQPNGNHSGNKLPQSMPSISPRTSNASASTFPLNTTTGTRGRTRIRDHYHYEAPTLPAVNQLPDRICSCRIVLFQDSSLKGNVLLYDSLKDPMIRKAYSNMRARSKQQNGTTNGNDEDVADTPTSNNNNSSSNNINNSNSNNNINNGNQATGDPITPNKNNTKRPTRPPPKKNYSSPTNSKMGVNDTSLLGEMIFGAIPMQIKGQNTKVHFLPAYKQTLLTKLFQVGIPASTLANVDPSFEKKKKQRRQKVVASSSQPNLKPHHDIKNQNSKSDYEIHVEHSAEDDRTTGSLSFHVIDNDYFDKRKNVHDTSSRPRSSSTSSVDYSHPPPIGLRKNASQSDLDTEEDTSSHTATDIFGETRDDDGPKLKKKWQRITRKRKKKSYSELNQYMCKSVFALGVVIVFHDNQSQNDAKAKTEFAQQSTLLQKLIFSHFAVIEHRMRKLLKTCSNAIRNYLKESVKHAQETGHLSKLFHGFTFNVRLIEHALQTDSEVCKSAMDFQKFVLSFLHTPRLERPLWYSHKMFMVDRVSIFSDFMNRFFYILDSHSPKMERFLSSLFTAVITHHLSWIKDYSSHECHIPFTDPSTTLAHELSALYGSAYWNYEFADDKSNNGLPLKSRFSGMKKFCKVVVVGSQEPLVRHLIYLLTYLLRSRRIVETDFSLQPEAQPQLLRNDEQLADPSVASTTSSSLSQSFLSSSYLEANIERNRSTTDTDETMEDNSPTTTLSTASCLQPINLLEISPVIRTETASVCPSDIFHAQLGKYSYEYSKDERDLDSCSLNVAKKLDFYSDEDSEEEDNKFEIVQMPMFAHLDQEKIFAKQGHRGKVNKFGHALYGDIGHTYCGALVVMGLPKNVDFVEEAVADLKLMQVETFDGDDEPPDVATCIVADTDDLVCNLIISSNSKKHYQPDDMKQYLPKNSSVKFEEALPSDFISDIFSNIRNFKMMGFSDSTCEAYLDDQLKQLYLKSMALVQIVDTLVQRKQADGTFASGDKETTPSKNSAVVAMLNDLEDGIDDPLTPRKIKEALSPRQGSNTADAPGLSISLQKVVTHRELASMLNMSVKDIPLLLSIAGAQRSDIPFFVAKRSMKK